MARLHGEMNGVNTSASAYASLGNGRGFKAHETIRTEPERIPRPLSTIMYANLQVSLGLRLWGISWWNQPVTQLLRYCHISPRTVSEKRTIHKLAYNTEWSFHPKIIFVQAEMPIAVRQ
jgi:hypothetical protein